MSSTGVTPRGAALRAMHGGAPGVIQVARLRVLARERERPAFLVAEPHAPLADLQDLRLAATDQVPLAGMAGMRLRGLPLTFGRRGYRTGFLARRSTENLKPFHALEQAVRDAVPGQHIRLPEQSPAERESVMVSRPFSPLERILHAPARSSWMCRAVSSQHPF